MNIIICGAGRVGLSIASYLSMQNNNDITIVDNNPDLIKRVSNTYDITGIVGHASQPDILKKAGADSAEIIIAVTDCDEVNMVACQVAHSVFQTPRKIARIRNKEYRDTAWSNLFSRNHMPIDVIISPEEEIADAIIQRMSVPGTTNDINLINDCVHISGLIVGKDSRICGQSIREIYLSRRQIEFRIFSIIRDGVMIDVSPDMILERSDEIYFICKQSDLFQILNDLNGAVSDTSGNIVICGGGVIGRALCNRIIEHESFSKNNLIVVEKNIQTARGFSKAINNNDVLVLNGSALDYDILKQANIEKTSAFITVMDSNENNILSAVLAKKMGCDYSIALSNNRLYNQLLPDRFIDAIVNPETITVSRVLKHLRQGHIQSIHSIRDTKSEIIEARVTENCVITNIPMEELSIDERIKILVVYSPEKNEVIFPNNKTVIKPNDIVVVKTQDIKQDQVESLFSFSINLF